MGFNDPPSRQPPQPSTEVEQRLKMKQEVYQKEKEEKDKQFAESYKAFYGVDNVSMDQVKAAYKGNKQ